MISSKNKIITGSVLLTIIFSILIWTYLTQRWYISLLIIPHFYLLYDVCFSKFSFNDEGIKVRTAQFFITKHISWSEIKAIKIDRFKPWGRLAIITHNNKCIYAYTDNPLYLREQLVSRLHKFISAYAK